MVKHILTKDSITGACEKSVLAKYPSVVNGDATVVVTPSVPSANGEVIYEVKASIADIIAGICANTTIKNDLWNCLTAGKADLSIQKFASSTTVVAGQPFTYTIVVSNNGPGAANGATVTDNLPAGFTASSTNWSYSNGAGGGSGSAPNFTITTFPSGSSATLTIVGTFASAGSFTNQASVATPPGVTETNGSNNATPGPGQPGAVTTSVTPANVAPVANTAATNTTFNTAVIVPLTANDTDADGDTLTVTSATVPALQGSISNVGSVYTFTPATGFSGIATISYTISDGQGHTASSTHTVVVGGAIADLGITKTSSTAAPVVGTDFNFVVAVTNNGPNAANGAVITENFGGPYAITSTTWAYTGGAGAGSGSASPFTIGTLPSGGTATLTITGQYTAAGTYTNVASVGTPSGVTDNNSANNATPGAGQPGAVTVTASPAVVNANLGITVTPSTATPQATVPMSYAIAFNNAGPSAANAATGAMTWPAGFTVSGVTWAYSGSAAGGSNNAGGTTFGITTLPSGGTATATVTGTYASAGTVSITGSVSPPAGITDPAMGNNSYSSGTVNVGSAPPAPTYAVNTSVTSATGLTASVGASTSVEFTYTNVGNQALSNVDVSLLIPDNIGSFSGVWAYGGATPASGGSVTGSNGVIANMPVGSTATYTITGTHPNIGSKFYSTFASVNATTVTNYPFGLGSLYKIEVGSAPVSSNYSIYTISHNGGGPFAVGVPFDMNFVVSNFGLTVAQPNVKIRLHIPPGVTLNSVTLPSGMTGSGEDYTYSVAANGDYFETCVFNVTSSKLGKLNFGVMAGGTDGVNDTHGPSNFASSVETIV